MFSSARRKALLFNLKVFLSRDLHILINLLFFYCREVNKTHLKIRTPTPPTSHTNISTIQALQDQPRVDQSQDYPMTVRPGLGQVAPDIIRTAALGGQRTAV